MTTPDSNRVYLAVPYAEKEEAKRHGARWDAERKLWWIDRREIVANPGIARWIVDRPGLVAQLREVADFLEANRQPARTEPTRRQPVEQASQGRQRRQAQQSASRRNTPALTPQTTFLLPERSCDCPPWEDCEHAAAAPICTTVLGAETSKQW